MAVQAVIDVALRLLLSQLLLKLQGVRLLPQFIFVPAEGGVDHGTDTEGVFIVGKWFSMRGRMVRERGNHDGLPQTRRTEYL